MTTKEIADCVLGFKLPDGGVIVDLWFGKASRYITLEIGYHAENEKFKMRFASKTDLLCYIFSHYKDD